MASGQHGQRLPRIVIAVLLVGLLVHAVQALVSAPGPEPLFNDGLYNLLMLGGLALCLARAVIVRPELAAWLAMAGGLAAWAGGDLLWSLHYNHVAEPPYPNWADASYLACYPFLYAGLVLLLRARLRPVRTSLWLDGAVSGLTLAALATALLFGPVLKVTGGDPSAVATNLAYPVGDLLLLTSVGVALSITGWRRAAPGAWSRSAPC